MSEALITVRDLTMGWGDLHLLERVSFEVERGEIFAILGASGCGKSTLLRYLSGLDEPLAGTVHIEGLGAPTLEVGRPAYGVHVPVRRAVRLDERRREPGARAHRVDPAATGGHLGHRARQVAARGAPGQASTCSPRSSPGAWSSGWRSRGPWRSSRA